MKRMLWVVTILLLTSMGIALPVGAQEPVEARLSTPAGQFTVGDPIQLTLTVVHPAGYHVILPDLEGSWGDFQVQSQSPATTVPAGDGRQATSQVIDVRLFSPGDFTTPPLPLAVTDGAGNLVETIAAPAPVTVSSVLQAGDATLRDIKPQAALPLPPAWPWAVAGLLAAAVVLAFAIWRHRRFRAVVDIRPPYQVALDELADIEGLDLPAQGRFKEHYTLTSNVIRAYVERTYSVPMLERTTQEIRASLDNSQVPPDIAGQLVAFLQASDLVKFSTVTPDVAGARELLHQARRLVEITRPAQDEQPSEAASSQHSSGRGLSYPQVEVAA